MAPTSLLFLDFDNTIVNAIDPSADRCRAAFEQMAEARGIDVERVLEDLPKVNMMSWIGDISTAVDGLPSLQYKSEEERQRLEPIDARIAQDWKIARDTTVETYPGVVEMIQAAKDAGAKVVIDTNATHGDLMHRLALSGVTADMLDGVICQEVPAVNGVKPPMELNTAEARLAADLADRTVLLTRDQRKPHDDPIVDMMNRFGATQETSIFVGDNHTDGQTAKAAGIRFAWYRPGAEVRPETQALQERTFGEHNHYAIGLEVVEKQMKDSGVWPPDITVEMHYDEMAAKIDFAPPPNAPKIAPAHEIGARPAVASRLRV